MPAPCEFLILAPGSFWGATIPLSSPEWNYGLVRGEHYSVYARVRISAHQWLDESVRLHQISGDAIGFDASFLEDEVIESKRLEIVAQ